MTTMRLGSVAGPLTGMDGATVLTVYIVLLLAIPSPMVVPALGSAGAPSSLWAVGCFGLWLWFKAHRVDVDEIAGAQPVRTAMLSWLLIMLGVYAHAMAMPISGDEISPADNGMLKLVGLAGVLLVANDGIPTLQRHRAVVRRLVFGAGIVAFLGLIQYATKQVIVDRIAIPGLASGNAAWSLAERSGLIRPSGTSTHPIEYGVVLTIFLPLAVTFAIAADRHRWLYRCILAVVGFAIFLSISRSAMLCALVALAVLAVTWSWTRRFIGFGLLLCLSIAVYLTVPGVLGTITRLFTGASDDPSIASRTGSYDIAFEFFARNPLLGRGFGTFLPKYWILDNGYLGLLIEGGLIGLGGLLVVIATAGVCARRARILGSSDFDRALGQALLASVAAGACGLAFFDTFGFPQSAGSLFLTLGLAGSMRRLLLIGHRTSDCDRTNRDRSPNRDPARASVTTDTA